MKLSVTVQNMREFQKRMFSASVSLLLASGALFADEVVPPTERGANVAATGEAVEPSATPGVVPAKAEPAVEKAEAGKAKEQGDEPISEAAAEAAEEAADKANQEGLDEARQVFGWKEWIKVGTKADAMRAKLDSGARTSSLHAEGIEEFERDGRPWVRFIMRDPNMDEFKEVLIKAPVQRVARVKNTDATIERRFVVELGFEIGDRQLREEFTLNDRSTMTCPVLIGRNALRHLGYLDCSRVDLADKKVMK